MCIQCGLLCKNGRAMAGYTQQQAAELLNISVESIGAYERGETEISIKKYVEMANLYGLSEYMCQQFCALVCPIGDLLGVKPLSNTDIDRIVVEFMCVLREAEPTKDKLLDIAADGIITNVEKPILAEIIKVLERFVNIYNNLMVEYNQKHTN